MNYIARGCMYCEGTCNKECLPKQETLEEAAERFYPTPNPYVMGIDIGNMMRREGFKEGAKWQQERMYSEEEVINAFNEGQALTVRSKLIQGKEWFEQFKKK